MATEHEIIPGCVDATELRLALNRADRIISWMADYVGRMAPPDGGIADLNEHWLFMERNGVPNKKPKRGDDRPLDQTPANNI